MSETGQELRTSIITGQQRSNPLLLNGTIDLFDTLHPSPRDLRPKRIITPQPVVYPGIYGKFDFVTHSGGRILRDVHYTAQDMEPVSLTGLSGPGVVFAASETGFGIKRERRRNHQVVFFDRDVLAVSPIFMLSLIYELGRTKTAAIEADLWQVFASRGADGAVSAFGNQYPALAGYGSDLAKLRRWIDEGDRKKKESLEEGIRHKTANGIDTRNINQLTNLVNWALDLWRGRAQKPNHAPNYFDEITREVPAVFSIVEPLRNRLAWEHALFLAGKFEEYGVRPIQQTTYANLTSQAFNNRHGVEHYTQGIVYGSLQPRDLPSNNLTLRTGAFH